MLPMFVGLWTIFLATSAWRVEIASRVVRGYGVGPSEAWSLVLDAPRAGRTYQAYEVYLIREADSIKHRLSDMGIWSVLAYVSLSMARLLAALDPDANVSSPSRKR
ncbi:MAG TPA: hypothetical protein VMW35_21625 [Myxococcota bacterium]|nr:hypothetical protein [Myxococcota bacterium]